MSFARRSMSRLVCSQRFLPTSSSAFQRQYIVATRPLHSTASCRAQPLDDGPPDMRNVLNELAKNPKAMKIFQAIQRDPQLLNQVQSLGLLLQQKGYIDPSQPTKQPGPIIMMRMVADSDIRSKMMEVAKLLKDAGALDTNGKPVDMSNVFELMMGSSSPPPEIKGTIGDGKGKDQQEKTTDEGLTGKIKSIFRK